MIYGWSKQPAFYQAVSAVQGGTATASQVAAVQAVTSTHTQPATKLQLAAKSVGGVLSIISTFGLGTAVGNGVATVLGYDVNGLVCAKGADTTGFLAVLTGADCSGVELDPEYPANADAAPGEILAGRCTTAGGAVPAAGQPAPTGAPTCGAMYEQMRLGSAAPYSYVQAAAAMITNVTAAGNEYTLTADRIGVGYTTMPSNSRLDGATFYVRCISSGGTIASGGASLVMGSGGGAGAMITRTASTSVTCATGSLGVVVYMNAPVPPCGTGLTCTAQYEGGLVYRTGQPLATTTIGGGDPQRTLRCVLLGDDGIEYTASTAPYTESSGALPAPVCPDLPAGVNLQQTTIWEDSPMGSTQIWQEAVTPEYAAAVDLAPECSDGTCMLDLRKGPTSCFQAPAECVDWLADPNRDTTYSCHYGAHAVALNECFVYGPTFRPEAQATGNLYGDPLTGQATDKPVGAPAGADENAYGTPTQNPAQSRQCFPQGWAMLNPVEWVMRPVQCALEWAFVPRESVVIAAGNTINNGLNGSIISTGARITSTFEAFFDISSAGCQGPPFRINLTGDLFPGGGMDETYYPLAACEEPMAQTATIFSLLTTMSIAVASLFASIRYFALVFGFSGLGQMMGIGASAPESRVKFK